MSPPPRSNEPVRPGAPPGNPAETAEHTAELTELEARFNRAVATMRMVFQPIVRAADRSGFAFEALLRSSEESLPHPPAILDAAERLNRITKLGRTIRARTAKAFVPENDTRLLFVNCTAEDLMDSSLTSPFTPLTKLAKRVVLEITERASLDEVGDVRYRVAELRQMGFRIAIDDLGAGHARMQRFRPLDTDFVKLDMSLVRDIDARKIKQELALSIIKLCRDQGILVIGEGVETEAEAEVLIGLGCDLLQGYLIARPGPLADVPPEHA